MLLKSIYALPAHIMKSGINNWNSLKHTARRWGEWEGNSIFSSNEWNALEKKHSASGKKKTRIV